MPQIYRINLYANLNDQQTRDDLYTALLAVLKTEKPKKASAFISNGISKDDYYQPTTVSESA
jgi:hypothetical protein